MLIHPKLPTGRVMNIGMEGLAVPNSFIDVILVKSQMGGTLYIYMDWWVISTKSI